MPLNRDVHLAGWMYDVEPMTGQVFSMVPEALWYRTEARRLSGPVFAPPDPHIMRDPSSAASWAATGGTPIVDSTSFRSLVPPWRARGG